MSAKAFGLALVCTAAALGLRLAIGLLDPAIPPFATFFASSLLTTILSGIAAGLVAAGLGLLLAWWTFSELLPHAFTLAGIALYTVSSLAIIWASDQYRRVLRRLQQKEAASQRQLALIVAEKDVLERVAGNAPLADTLDQLTRTAEAYSGGKMLASVLLMDPDGEHLRHGAAPSLPAAYNDAIDGAPVGPAVGSCGTAAYLKKPVYVTDIQNDPLWKDYRDLALKHGLKACWSVPIMSNASTVLGTFALYHTETRSPSEDERNIVELMARIAAVAIEHERDNQQRRILVDELAHRVRNTLTVVHSVAASTLRPHTPPDKYKAFEDRLRALAEAQRLLTETNWSDVSLHELVNSVAVTPFAADGTRFQLDGPPTSFPARMALPFALSLHELSTNAAKYGALSREDGRILIKWGYEGGDARERKFYFRWLETGGPPVTEPTRQGFGTRMIQHAFSGDFSGVTALEYRPEGLVCEVSLPAAHVAAGVPRAEAPPTSAA
jgi:two-component sensor histidine kinase